MGWWKADPIPASQPSPASVPVSAAPHPLPASTDADPASSCPVDPKTRAIWLQQAAQKKQSTRTETPSQPRAQTTPPPPPSNPPVPNPKASLSSRECSSDTVSQSPVDVDTTAGHKSKTPLSHDRVISSIPRGALASSPTGTPSSALPANSEAETGTHASGNWIYPSESQFFQAVMRKQSLSPSTSPTDLAQSVSAIIPIHNAVNERAWAMIKQWEGPETSAACGGPKLVSFKGLGAGAISPKAKLKSYMGYTEPFDRHDWVVQRCGGETVEYVIDFYQGKAPETTATSQKSVGGSLNFYLDVRPKLNSFDGWKMRAERFVGWR